MALTLVLRAMRITPEKLGEPGRRSLALRAARATAWRAGPASPRGRTAAVRSAGRNWIERDAAQLVGPRDVATADVQQHVDARRSQGGAKQRSPGRGCVPIADQAQIPARKHAAIEAVHVIHAGPGTHDIMTA